MASEQAFPPVPPPEVLDALDRAAGVLRAFDRRHVSLELVHDAESGEVRVSVTHQGEYRSRELSGSELLNLLDGDTGEP